MCGFYFGDYHLSAFVETIAKKSSFPKYVTILSAINCLKQVPCKFLKGRKSMQCFQIDDKFKSRHIRKWTMNKWWTIDEQTMNIWMSK